MSARLLFAAVLLCAGLCAAAVPPVFHVAVNGDDAWSGTLPEPNTGGTDGPFLTLGRAQNALRAAGTADGGMVYVHAGAYHLTEPLVLEKEDSGSETFPVVWQAVPGDTVRIVGGRPVTVFTPHAGDILKADMTPFALPKGAPRQLFFNGERQIPARWPNKGEDDMPGGKWAFVQTRVDAAPETSFVTASDRPAGWKSLAGVEVSIWPNYNWWQTVAPLKAFDPATRTVELGEKLPYTIEPGRRFFFQNVLEELDAPGEFCLDDASNTLYFLPPASMEAAEVIVPAVETLVRMKGAAHVAWMGFTLEACTAEAVRIEDCEAVLAARCVIRNTGGYGAVVRGGKQCRVAGCDIYATGRGGVSLDGGDRKTLTPAAHEAVNNHIHHFGAIFQTYQTGVTVAGVGSRIANNLIHDAPHIGILLNGNDHTIEYNDIHHVCLEGSDNGGFYMGRDWTQRGNVLRFNKFHDIYGFGLSGLAAGGDGKYHYEAPHQAWGVYLDDCSSGVTVQANIFYRVPLCGVMIGGGRDNLVDNNVFVDCVPALHIDDRWDAYCWDLMQERLEAMDYQNPPFSTRYPELLKMGDDPRRPANNSFTNNVVAYTRDDYRGLSTAKPGSSTAVVYNLSPYDPETTAFDNNLIFHTATPKVAARSYKKDDAADVPWTEWQARGHDKNSRLADPKFFRPEEDNYMMRHNSPAFEMGIRDIPDYRIGLYRDEFRASWPPPAQDRRDGGDHREWVVEP